MNPDIHAQLAEQHAIPGRVLGIWSLVMSFLVPIIGLVLGLVALRQSRRARVPNPLAVAGVTVSIVLGLGATVTTIAIWA
jgi:hypothetical protein